MDTHPNFSIILGGCPRNLLFAMFFSVAGLGAIAVYTLRQFTNHLLRLLVLVIGNVWLCFFWVWSDGNLISLMPPAILYLANRIVRE